MSTTKLLTKEQYNTLQPYEQQLNQAKNDYIHGIYSRDVIIIESVYNQLGYHLESRTCGSCLLSMCKILSGYYDKYKIRYFNKKQKNDNQTDNI